MLHYFDQCKGHLYFEITSKSLIGRQDITCLFLLRKEPRNYSVAKISLTFEPRREKTGFCICENKDADQLRGNREADQRLCFRYTDSTIPLLPNSEISCLSPSSVAVQPGLCWTWSETPKTGFLTTRLI